MTMTSKSYLLLYWLENNYFKEMFLKAEKDNLDIVVSDIIWDYDNGKFDTKKDLNISDDVFINQKEYLQKLFKGEVFACVWNKMYKLKLYKDNNIIYPLNISLGEDFVTTSLLASKANKIGKINKGYVHYIQNIQSITKSNPTKKIYELISAFDLLEQKLYFEKNDKINLNSIKIINLTNLVLNPKYKFSDIFYKEALHYYCNLFKKEFRFIGKSKKNKIYFIFLKRWPNIKMLMIIYYFNKIIINLKENIKNRVQ